jgi:CopG antitoxin of type II toxin-antitoxin system
MVKRPEAEAANLPRFQDETEAGDFWDTHSPLDYPDEFREVDVAFSRPLIKRGLTVKLSEDTLQDLRRLAAERGIGPSTLARMWILEHLKVESEHRPAMSPRGR